MKALLPIILIAAAIGLFFLKINPQYFEIKALRATAAQYDNALEVAEKLKALRGKLAEKLDSFPPEQLAKLSTFIPERLDTVRIILDVSGIAGNYGIVLKDIKTADSAQTQSSSNAPAGNAKTYNTTSIGFTFNSTYSNAVDFIKAVEESLRLLDVVSVAVKPSQKGNTYDFAMTVNTYWIPQK